MKTTLSNNRKPDFTKLHPQAIEYLKKMEAAEAPPLHTVTPEQIPAVRKEFNTGILQFLGKPAELASVRDITAATGLCDMRIKVYTPEGSAPFPVFVFIHGGGWVFGNPETHDRHCRYISRFTECITVSVDYSPSPEHPFPAALEECYAACRWTAEHLSDIGGKPGPMAIGGDSAGGNVSAAIALLARERGFTGIGYQLLLYPALNLAEQNTESYRLFGEGYGLSKKDTEWFVIQYVPAEEDRFKPLASPLLAESTSDLPPAHIITAGHDPLRDDGKLYAEKLRRAGVPVTYKCYEDQLHGFLNYDGIFDTAETAFREVSEHLKSFYTTGICGK